MTMLLSSMLIEKNVLTMLYKPILIMFLMSYPCAYPIILFPRNFPIFLCESLADLQICPSSSGCIERIFAMSGMVWNAMAN